MQTLPDERAQANIYERDLGRNAANFQPLTPLTFLDWSASVYPDRTARSAPSTPTLATILGTFPGV